MRYKDGLNCKENEFMAVPRNRTSNARKNSRRAHHAKKARQFAKCSNCGKAMMSHRMCPHCGYYDGAPVIRAKDE